MVKQTTREESATTDGKIDSLLNEERRFTPPLRFQESAHIKKLAEYEQLWQQSISEPEEFWRQQATARLSWSKPFTEVLDWKPPHAQWFADGEINACYNCVDRHIDAGKGEKTAILWEGEPGDKRKLTYKELHQDISKTSNILKKLGVSRGDRVTIYMPMIPEMITAVLACARIGATHSVVFAGFSSEALSERNNDAKAKLVITADGLYRKGKILNLKEAVDSSLESSPTVENVLVWRRTQQTIHMQPGRDIDWQAMMHTADTECPAESLPAEHPLFILYTSGSTGKPKGILHTTAGYLLGANLSTHYVFDLRDDDVYWCTADVGWITGHSYIIYGPLSHGATLLMYEGAPNYPEPDRFWSLIDTYKVSIFYTAPTAIRAFIKWGDHHVDKHDLSSLRLLGTVGEPINPEAWMWYRDKIGKGRCPIVDTWWQTETGSIMITPLPGVSTTTPGTATRPFFGIDPEIVDKQGKPVADGQGGYLVINKPWPSMLRTLFGDDARYRSTYWEQVPGKYFTGDGARKDHEGNFWILGRIDDVINVSGHRLSTMEIESALVSHPKVAEAAVVGKPHELTGESIACFVSLEGSHEASPLLKKEISEHIVKNIGALARPESINFTPTLPKTRSGKIMRRLLRDIASGKDSKGDKSTLEDHSVLDQLRDQESV